MTPGFRFIAFFFEGLFISLFGAAFILMEYFIFGLIYISNEITAIFTRSINTTRFNYLNNYYSEKSIPFWIASSVLIFNIIFQVIGGDSIRYVILGLIFIVSVFYGLHKSITNKDYNIDFQLSGVRSIKDEDVKFELYVFGYFPFIVCLLISFTEISQEYKEFSLINLAYLTLLILGLIGSFFYTNSRLKYARILQKIEEEAELKRNQ